MQHPRCVHHWRYLSAILDKLVQEAKDVGISWSKGPGKGGLTLTLTFSPRGTSRADMYEGFDQQLRKDTPELQDGSASGSPP